MLIIKLFLTNAYTFLRRSTFSLIILFGVNLTHASVIILPLEEILEFDQINISNNDGFSFPTHQDENGVIFITYFVLQGGYASADVGKVNALYDWSGFDFYDQSIFNYDDNPWSFSVSVKDIAGNIVSSDTVEIAQFDNNVFSLSLLPLTSREIIDDVWVTVSGDVPLPNSGNDAVSEWELSFGLGSAAEVPLPPASFLYIAAISGFVLARRPNI